jgi:hypothetical protein
MWRTSEGIFVRIFRFPVARAGACCAKKLPVFGQSDPRSGLCETDHAAPLKRLLNAPEVWAGCWRPVVFSLPEANGSFIDLQFVGETLLRQPRKNTGRTELTTCDKIRDHVVPQAGAVFTPGHVMQPATEGATFRAIALYL